MIKLIATDLDGTLLFPKRSIGMVSRANKKVLREFVSQGGKVVIASGRGLAMCRKIVSAIEIPCDYVPYGGGACYLNGETLSEGIIPVELLNKIYDFLAQSGGRIYWVVNVKNDEIYAFGPKINAFEKMALGLYLLRNLRYNEKRIFVDKSLREQVFAKGVLKITLIYVRAGFQTSAGLAKLAQVFAGQVHAFLTHHACEITLHGYNKGTMVAQIANKLGFKPEEVAVIGDDINDVTMFERFPNSFVMERARAEIKAQAKNVIKSFKDVQSLL